MSLPEPTDVAAMDVAPTKRWRRLIPRWLRSLFWVDSAARYDGFLSYSWTCDKEIAPVVQSVIQRFLCPWYKVRAKTVFRDLSCLPAGSSLNTELFTRLDRSIHFIVFASPEAPNSRGMEAEAKHWLSRTRSGEIVILVTDVSQHIANSEENAAATNSTNAQIQKVSCNWEEIRDHLLPPALRNYFATTEPLWLPLAHRRAEILRDPGSANLRGEMIEDLKQLFLRLYPGTTWEQLHGEERSQKRRAMSLLAGLAALLLLAAVSVVWEWNKSVKVGEEAAYKYSLALGVVNSTSQVVKEQLLPEGAMRSKGVLADNLLTGPLNAFKDIPSKYETPRGAYSRVQLFDVLWNNFYLLGKLAEASSASDAEFEIAHRHFLAKRFEKGDPTRADWLAYLVHALQHNADDKRARGNLAPAELQFKEALDLAKHMPTGPEGEPWKDELPRAYERVGDILRDESKFPESLANYEKLLEFPWSRQGPHGQRSLAVAHGKIADILIEQGDLPGAAHEFEFDLILSEGLAAEFPGVGDWLRGVMVSHERLGFVYRKEGHAAAALKEYQTDVSIGEELAKSDPANLLWRSDLALAYEGLGDLASDKHNWAAAYDYYTLYFDGILALRNDSPFNTKWRRDVAVGHQRIGIALEGLGRTEEAKAKFDQCIADSTDLIAAFDPRNPEPRDVLADCKARSSQIISKSAPSKAD
ncbi:MAG TPA: tetratricopeptide repeat protein [Candidatus Acidoferrum sp.]|nr:tetratricopeptide repeat protein [Candidatus Acidoferrum sp.]